MCYWIFEKKISYLSWLSLLLILESRVLNLDLDSWDLGPWIFILDSKLSSWVLNSSWCLSWTLELFLIHLSCSLIDLWAFCHLLCHHLLLSSLSSLLSSKHLWITFDSPWSFASKFSYISGPIFLESSIQCCWGVGLDQDMTGQAMKSFVECQWQENEQFRLSMLNAITRSSPMLVPSFYRTSNKLRYQCFELLHLHFYLFLNQPPYLPYEKMGRNRNFDCHKNHLFNESSLEVFTHTHTHMSFSCHAWTQGEFYCTTFSLITLFFKSKFILLVIINKGGIVRLGRPCVTFTLNFDV